MGVVVVGKPLKDKAPLDLILSVPFAIVHCLQLFVFFIIWAQYWSFFVHYHTIINIINLIWVQYWSFFSASIIHDMQVLGIVPTEAQ